MSVLYCRNFCAGGSVAAQPSWESSPEVRSRAPMLSSSSTRRERRTGWKDEYEVVLDQELAELGRQDPSILITFPLMVAVGPAVNHARSTEAPAVTAKQGRSSPVPMVPPTTLAGWVVCLLPTHSPLSCGPHRMVRSDRLLRSPPSPCVLSSHFISSKETTRYSCPGIHSTSGWFGTPSLSRSFGSNSGLGRQMPSSVSVRMIVS
mmetsp:Transcript_54453/g.150007  ORF Transcript_54453/g.150007 Transcript_54453/m.150007 type:complete len:205 (-) Transcript_54453:100-714(-)